MPADEITMRWTNSFTGNTQRLVLARDAAPPFTVPEDTCPVCAGAVVLLAHDVRRVVVVPKEQLPAAGRMTLIYHGAAGEAIEEAPDGPLCVMPEAPQEHDYSVRAEARCRRCHSLVGTLQINSDTLFGRRETNLCANLGIFITGD